MALMNVAELVQIEDAGIHTMTDHELERIVARLERGFEVLENHRAKGKVVAEWDDEWIRLLRRYEWLLEQRAA